MKVLAVPAAEPAEHQWGRAALASRPALEAPRWAAGARLAPAVQRRGAAAELGLEAHRPAAVLPEAGDVWAATVDAPAPEVLRLAAVVAWAVLETPARGERLGLAVLAARGRAPGAARHRQLATATRSTSAA